MNIFWCNSTHVFNGSGLEILNRKEHCQRLSWSGYNWNLSSAWLCYKFAFCTAHYLGFKRHASCTANTIIQMIMFVSNYELLSKDPPCPLATNKNDLNCLAHVLASCNTWCILFHTYFLWKVVWETYQLTDLQIHILW